MKDLPARTTIKRRLRGIVLFKIGEPEGQLIEKTRYHTSGQRKGITKATTFSEEKNVQEQIKRDLGQGTGYVVQKGVYFGSIQQTRYLGVPRSSSVRLLATSQNRSQGFRKDTVKE